jgi:hypothetical protein
LKDLGVGRKNIAIVLIWEVVDWIELVQDNDHCSALVKTIMAFLVS